MLSQDKLSVENLTKLKASPKNSFFKFFNIQNIITFLICRELSANQILGWEEDSFVGLDNLLKLLVMHVLLSYSLWEFILVIWWYEWEHLKFATFCLVLSSLSLQDPPTLLYPLPLQTHLHTAQTFLNLTSCTGDVNFLLFVNNFYLNLMLKKKLFNWMRNWMSLISNICPNEGVWKVLQSAMFTSRGCFAYFLFIIAPQVGSHWLKIHVSHKQ